MVRSQSSVREKTNKKNPTNQLKNASESQQVTHDAAGQVERPLLKYT